MSVEEARSVLNAAFNDAVYRFQDDVSPLTRQRFHGSVDRLILEVQAAMPCSGRFAIWCNDGTAELSEPCNEREIWRMNIKTYRRDAGGLLPLEAFEDVPLPLDQYCPSCTARAELTRRKVAV